MGGMNGGWYILNRGTEIFFFRDPKERYVTIKAILRSGVAFRRRRLHWRWGSCEGGGLGSVTGDDETNGRLSESEEEEE